MDLKFMTSFPKQMSRELEYYNESKEILNGIYHALNQSVQDLLFTSGSIINYGILFMVLGGLGGSGIVLCHLCFYMKRNLFSVYILNLAGTDFILLFSFIMDWCFRRSILSITMSGFLSYTMRLALLTAISTERCLSVLFPIGYQSHRPKLLSAIMCALLWAPAVLDSSLRRQHFPPASRFLDLFNFYGTSNKVLFFILVIVLCISTLTFLLRIQCSSQPHEYSVLFLLILLMVLLFLTCGIPFGIFTFVRSRNAYYFQNILILLLSGNSFAHPLIYFSVGSLRQRKLGGPLRVVLQKALEDEVDTGVDGEMV
ncbi:LOW QUALITY PROTEIN: mas-related G-protein coupled receptor member X2-like [Gracilinanus agilis]|uniref:LOW QUALITY PROTEIN: mas-related G-protein coupled receptor member X2-like n=1 Tax=Gracilinanus agilis TaxID=191870 RepID=UPI001CFC4DAF|nr:LOW QUALITY PROTEIN: mas-related G-protein coupled receptor member X2-like [Gracilinanus agilis]